MLPCTLADAQICLGDHDEIVGCCPLGTQCSSWGCVTEASLDTVFLSSSTLLWVAVLMQAVIVVIGFAEFIVGTVYYRVRRNRSAERVQRSAGASSIVNDERELDDSRGAPPRQLKAVSELNGRCCGCGGIADMVLLPCKHAVCCSGCSSQAKLCPFCNKPSTSCQRLYPV